MIHTQKDGFDFLEGNAYILGAPVLQSLNIVLDFKANKIGLGQKVNDYGACLLDPNSKLECVDLKQKEPEQPEPVDDIHSKDSKSDEEDVNTPDKEPKVPSDPVEIPSKPKTP